jgi:hypothetical protein
LVGDRVDVVGVVVEQRTRIKMNGIRHDIRSKIVPVNQVRRSTLMVIPFVQARSISPTIHVAQSNSMRHMRQASNTMIGTIILSSRQV